MSTTQHLPESKVRIACLQMEPVIGDKEKNTSRSLELIEMAAGAGANLVVLPELCNTGYVFETREEAFSLAEEIPEGPTTAKWAAAAARHNMHIVAGITERDGRALYNSAAIVGPQGFVGNLPKEPSLGSGEPVLRAGRPGRAGVSYGDRPDLRGHLLRHLVS